jgi:hypothetical protein
MLGAMLAAKGAVPRQGVRQRQIRRSSAAMKAAKARGVRSGSLGDKGAELERQAKGRAERLRNVFEGLSGLSAREAAERLNARGYQNVRRKWHATQVSQYEKPRVEARGFPDGKYGVVQGQSRPRP